MSKAHALPTGLGIENENFEIPLEELPEWEDKKIKIFPLVCFGTKLAKQIDRRIVLEKSGHRQSPRPGSSMWRSRPAY